MHLLQQDAKPQKKCNSESVKKHHWTYDRCPDCQEPKHKHAKTCFDCMMARRRPPIDPNTYVIEGVECRKLPLTKKQYATVDAADYDWLMQWGWPAHWAPTVNGYYAVRHSVEDKSVQIRMHRQILGLAPNDPRKGDHIDPSKTLENRRKNLRKSTKAQNNYNQRLASNNTVGLKGVSKLGNRFRARLSGKHIGLFG